MIPALRSLVPFMVTYNIYGFKSYANRFSMFVYVLYFKSTKALSIEKLSLFYGSKSEMTCPIVVEFEFLFYFLPEDHAIGLSTFTVMAGLGGNYLFYFTIVMT